MSETSGDDGSSKEFDRIVAGFNQSDGIGDVQPLDALSGPPSIEHQRNILTNVQMQHMVQINESPFGTRRELLAQAQLLDESPQIVVVVKQGTSPDGTSRKLIQCKLDPGDAYWQRTGAQRAYRYVLIGSESLERQGEDVAVAEGFTEQEYSMFSRQANELAKLKAEGVLPNLDLSNGTIFDPSTALTQYRPPSPPSL